VLGNHDRTIPEANMTTLRAAMQSAGVTLLVNETARVRVGSDAIYIAGVDDYGNGRPDIRGVAAQMAADDYVIFLSHSPAAIPDALKATDKDGLKGWFDLGLFGHTHGGQIALVGELLGISHVDARYERGWLKENRADILISHGVGTSLLPIRVLRPPQLHVITVKAK
jgi:predicted MPP superfamily phosphohydrolase